MHKKIVLLGCLIGIPLNVFAADLLDVYHQALQSDPIYKEAYAQEMSTAEAVPTERAALLPQIDYTGAMGANRTTTESNTATPITTRSTARQRTLNYTLSLTQSVFNFTNWQNLMAAKETVKAASATYSAAAQDLMKRVVTTYFAVLQAQDILRYSQAQKDAFYQEYVRANQGYKVGVNTITDMYNAKAAYDAASADYVAAQNDLSDRKEELRVITGTDYSAFSSLKENLPLISPTPSDVNQWVTTALSQNWSLMASRYNTLAAHQNVLAAEGGHLPTVDFTTQYDNNYTRTTATGRTRVKGPSAGLDLTVPLFSGGGVSSAARKSQADYAVAMNQEESEQRAVMNDTRQSYLGVMSDVNKVKADHQAIISNQSSLRAMKVGYQVGTRTMVDVLNAQKSLYDAEKTWAMDRYDYIIQMITLKEAAGTLNESDLSGINHWLESPEAQLKNVINRTTKTKKGTTSKVSTKTSNTANAIKGPYFYLQVGAYRSMSMAKAMVAKVNAFSNAICRVYSGTSQGKPIYRVKVGPLGTRTLAEQMSQEIIKKGLPKPLLTSTPNVLK